MSTWFCYAKLGATVDMCCSMKDLVRRPIGTLACDWPNNWRSKTEWGLVEGYPEEEIQDGQEQNADE